MPHAAEDARVPAAVVLRRTLRPIVAAALAPAVRERLDRAGDAGADIATSLAWAARSLDRVALANAAFRQRVDAVAAGTGSVTRNRRRRLGLAAVVRASAKQLAGVAETLDGVLAEAEAECRCAASASPPHLSQSASPVLSALDRSLALVHAVATLLTNERALDRVCQAGTFGEMLMPGLSELCDALDMLSANVMDHCAAFQRWPESDDSPERQRAVAAAGSGIYITRVKLHAVGALFAELFAAARTNAEACDAAYVALADGAAAVCDPQSAITVAASRGVLHPGIVP